MKNNYNRRQFIKQTSMVSFASLLSGHLLFSASCKHPHNEVELIKEIRLLTNAAITELVQFYHNQLGFEVLEQGKDYCTFRTGSSSLTFVRSTKENAPFYHFAFNIPENRIKKAEQWLQTKTQFIKPPEHLSDPSLQSENIVHFAHWDAHALFFYDPAGNVVEFIARHTLENKKEGDFTIDDILYISEIGLAVDDVFDIADTISGHTGLTRYKSASKDFFALGDEKGLLILFKEDTKSAFRKGKPRKTYGAEITLTSQMEEALKMKEYPFVIKN